MSDTKLFLVQYKGNPDLRESYEPIRAVDVESDSGGVVFYAADDTVVGYFDSSIVDNWREISEQELKALGERLDAAKVREKE